MREIREKFNASARLATASFTHQPANVKQRCPRSRVVAQLLEEEPANARV
jgi:hypothetical protein